MTKKKRPIIWIVGITLCLCAVPVVGITLLFFFPAILNPFMPIYSFKMIPSTHTGYTHYTLTRGKTTYESDYEEYALSSPGNDHEIGQTSSGMRLIEIYGQKKYIVVYDFMDQVAVFRDSRYPAIDLSTAIVTDMKLASLAYAPGLGPEKDTQDSHLIQNVLAALTTGTPITAPPSGSNLQKYCLFLSGGDLIGMQYCVGVYVDASGQVYLARDTLSKEWFQASDLLSDWVKTP